MYTIGYVAYFELNIDYIIKTYCVNKEIAQLECHGKCHLAKQLSPASDTQTGGDAIINIAESFFPVYYSTYPLVKFETSHYFYKKELVLSQTQNYNFTFVYSHFKPPIA